MTLPSAVSLASDEALPDFERGVRLQVVYSAEGLYRNIEPCGDFTLRVALLDGVMVLFLELALDVVMRVDDFLFRNVLNTWFQVPIREIYDGFGVNVNFSVTDFEMQVRSGRFPCIAGQPDDIAGVDLFADFHEPFGKMPV